MSRSEDRTCLSTEGSSNEVTFLIVVLSLNEGSPASTRNLIATYARRRRSVERVYARRHTDTRSGGIFRFPFTPLPTEHTVYAVVAPLVRSFQDIGCTKALAETNRLLKRTLTSSLRIYIIFRFVVTSAESVGRRE